MCDMSFFVYPSGMLNRNTAFPGAISSPMLEFSVISMLECLSLWTEYGMKPRNFFVSYFDPIFSDDLLAYSPFHTCLIPYITSSRVFSDGSISR